MDVKINGNGNTIAGRDINLVLTPESATALGEALIQAQGHTPVNIDIHADGSMRVFQNVTLEDLLALRGDVYREYFIAQYRRWVNSVTVPLMIIAVFCLMTMWHLLTVHALPSWITPTTLVLTFAVTAAYMMVRWPVMNALHERAQLASFKASELEKEIGRRKVGG